MKEVRVVSIEGEGIDMRIRKSHEEVYIFFLIRSFM